MLNEQAIVDAILAGRLHNRVYNGIAFMSTGRLLAGDLRLSDGKARYYTKRDVEWRNSRYLLVDSVLYAYVNRKHRFKFTYSVRYKNYAELGWLSCMATSATIQDETFLKVMDAVTAKCHLRSSCVRLHLKHIRALT